MNMVVREGRVSEDRMSRAGAAVRLSGVAKAFGAVTVLHGIDLSIEAGQFVAIVGRSGCGKSTLLRLIAGLDRPTSGVVEADDVRLMFQEARLLPWQRVAANVAVGLSQVRDAGARRRLAQEALGQVGLGGRAGEWPPARSWRRCGNTGGVGRARGGVACGAVGRAEAAGGAGSRTGQPSAGAGVR
jgi:sulfonate transport system ATP-binding protein